MNLLEITYTNEKGNSIKLGQVAPFFVQQLDGFSDVDNIIHTVKSVDQDGATGTGSQLEVRHLVINGVFTGSTQRQRNKLIQTFNPKYKGLLTYERGDLKRKIECRPERVPVIPSSHSGSVSFMINLQANDPYWKDMHQRRYEIAEWIGGFEFDLTIPKEGIYMGYREPSLIVSVSNEGDAKSGMEIVFRAKGTLSNPSLFNVNTREKLTIQRDMVAGEQVVVNTTRNERSVTLIKNGEESDVFNAITLMSEWLELSTGDNLFRYDADTGLDNLDVTIYFDNQYVGV